MRSGYFYKINKSTTNILSSANFYICDLIAAVIVIGSAHEKNYRYATLLAALHVSMAANL